MDEGELELADQASGTPLWWHLLSRVPDGKQRKVIESRIGLKEEFITRCYQMACVLVLHAPLYRRSTECFLIHHLSVL